MLNTGTYSLWLEPNGKVSYHLRKCIKKLSVKYKTPVFEPHVTLLGNIKATETESISLTNTLASTLHPFELTLTTAGHHNHFYQCLFIHVRESKDLTKLRKMAVRFFDGSKDEKYMPHLSLLYGDFTPKEKELMINDAGREFYINFTVKSLVLMQTEGLPDQWNKIYTAVFKSP